MDKKPFLTVFTPTYNRASTLDRLYQSLIKQTKTDFEWLIVDDGSDDDTDVLINEWKKEGKVFIRYYYQSNNGKPSAHNRGVKEAKGTLFVCVDSDDYLSNDAIDCIYNAWDSKNEENHGIIGLLLKKASCSSGEEITIWSKDVKVSSLYDGYMKYGLRGDTVLVYRTEIINKYAFDLTPGERFVPEAFLYDLLDREGKLIYTDKVIYFCEYLPDGYSASMKKVNAKNPHGYKKYIIQRLQFEIKEKKCGILQIIKDIIRLISIDVILKENVYEDLRDYKVIRILALGLYPVGYLRWFLDFRKYTEKYDRC